MTSKTIKTVKVPDSTAEEWDRYVQENAEVDSISHLIRLSVQKEISGNYDRGSQAEGGSEGGASADTGEILTKLQKIETSIGDVEERLTTLEAGEAAEAKYDIQRAAYDALPTPPEEPGAETHEWAKTAGEVATELGAEEQRVADALESLQDTTRRVQGRIGGPNDETYYFRRGSA